ncbi:MAG: hypothetical protein Q8K63_11585 [Acidimicrobiales bacterium]|nr:hypothetical protein [Acidimicrobiales bacterium]
MEMVSYQDFGAAFIDEAVSLGRIEQAVTAVAGDNIEVGPIGVGPGDAASVIAKGSVGAAKAKAAAPEADGTRRFVVSIPVELRLSVKVAGTLHKFEASIVVRLHLAARTAVDPLALVIDITPPQVFDMEVTVRSTGMAARVLGRLGNVDGKIRKEVVGFITERLNAPDAKAATVIDIATHIEAVWKS